MHHSFAAGPGLYFVISRAVSGWQSCLPKQGVPERDSPDRGSSVAHLSYAVASPSPGRTAGRKSLGQLVRSRPSDPSPLPPSIPEGMGRTCRLAGDTPTARRRAVQHSHLRLRPRGTSASGVRAASSGSGRGTGSQGHRSCGVWRKAQLLFIWPRRRNSSFFPPVGGKVKLCGGVWPDLEGGVRGGAYATWSGLVVIVCWVAKSCPTLWLHGLQRTRLPCHSLSSRVCTNPCPLSRWCSLTVSSSAGPPSFTLSLFQHRGLFPVSRLFAYGGQSSEASATVLPVTLQGWA